MRVTTLMLCALTTILCALTRATEAEPRASDGLAIRFGDVRLATGVRLRYAEQSDSAGEPVILLHGYSDSWFSFSRVLPLLPEGYRVFAVDQRGHGDSDRPDSDYAMRDLAADVLAFMDAKGLPRATVVSHSMGSFVAQQVALAAPHRVTRLVSPRRPPPGPSPVSLSSKPPSTP